MFINPLAIVNIVGTVASIGGQIVSGLVGNKISDNKMNETIKKAVAEEVARQMNNRV